MADIDDYLPVDKSELGELITDYSNLLEITIEVTGWVVFLIAMVTFGQIIYSIKTPRYWSLETERKTY